MWKTFPIRSRGHLPPATLGTRWAARDLPWPQPRVAHTTNGERLLSDMMMTTMAFSCIHASSRDTGILGSLFSSMYSPCLDDADRPEKDIGFITRMSKAKEGFLPLKKHQCAKEVEQPTTVNVVGRKSCCPSFLSTYLPSEKLSAGRPSRSRSLFRDTISPFY